MAISFDSTGRPLPSDHGVLSCRGADLTASPSWAQLQVDVASRARVSSVTGVDDDCDGTIDEPGEFHPPRSIGAFFQTCDCRALQHDIVLF
jgi:hypothetical protein